MLTAQFWLDGAPVEVGALLSMTPSEVDSALYAIGEEDLDSTVTRDRLPDGVLIGRVDEVDAGVAELVRELNAAAERMRRFADVDAFIEATTSDEQTAEDARMVVPVLLAVVAGRRRAAQALARQ